MVAKPGWILFVVVVASLAVACGSTGPQFVDGGDDFDATVQVDAPIDASSCGDGTRQTGEDCDLGANNGQPGFCCTSACAYAGATVECRAAAGPCDLAESCTGTSADCPAEQSTDGMSCGGGGLAGTTCCSGACSHVTTPGTCDACALTAHGPQRVTIIESQSINSGHVMDFQWQTVASAAGHTATIVPQTTLDDLANLAQTDILVVASGVGPLSAARAAVIDQFVASGHGVYLQGEYQTTYETNIAFGNMVNAHGAAFSWTATVSGQQDPTTVNGCLATIPEAAPTLTAYWYACTGNSSGDNLEVIHTAPGGQPIGWSLCFPGGGKVIFNTDQDFIRTPATNTPEHMRNVLAWLADAANCDTTVLN